MTMMGHDFKARFTAQGKLLSEATKDVFDLKTQRKANQHKIDRLHDYEAQIQHFLEVRKIWCVFWSCSCTQFP